MKYIFDEKRRLDLAARQGIALFLDFDLTLSPLADRPQKAKLPLETKAILKKLSRSIPVTIITGRALLDIRKRVGLSSVQYVGNHGLEYTTSGVQKNPPVRALKGLVKKFQELEKKYPNTEVENKKFAVSFHYRRLPVSMAKQLQRELRNLEKGLEMEGLRSSFDKKTFEVRPDSTENKGTAIMRLLQTPAMKNRAPVYVGDSQTDEDAFKALPRGLTIRVGKTTKSAAKYYVRNQHEVATLLESIRTRIQKHS